MPDGGMHLPGMEKVNIIGGPLAHLMQIADPHPDWIIDRLSITQLKQLVKVGIEYRQNLIRAEQQALEAQSKALETLQGIYAGMAQRATVK